MNKDSLGLLLSKGPLSFIPTHSFLQISELSFFGLYFFSFFIISIFVRTQNVFFCSCKILAFVSLNWISYLSLSFSPSLVSCHLFHDSFLSPLQSISKSFHHYDFSLLNQVYLTFSLTLPLRTCSFSLSLSLSLSFSFLFTRTHSHTHSLSLSFFPRSLFLSFSFFSLFSFSI